MKKKFPVVVVGCHYTDSSSHGKLAVDYPVGLTDLNVHSVGFSKPAEGLLVRFFAITKGFSISGSQNGHPLSEETLLGFAHRLINLINGAEVDISWDSHDFLKARKHNTSFRRQPQTTTGPSAPTMFRTHASVLNLEFGV